MIAFGKASVISGFMQQHDGKIMMARRLTDGASVRDGPSYCVQGAPDGARGPDSMEDDDADLCCNLLRANDFIGFDLCCNLKRLHERYHWKSVNKMTMKTDEIRIIFCQKKITILHIITNELLAR